MPTSRPRRTTWTAAVDQTSLTVATDQGFGLTEPGPDGDLAHPLLRLGRAEVGPISPETAALQTTGQLLTTAIDSGQPRCRWHRVRVDADVPAGTSVAVSVATSEDATTRPPNPQDWQDGGVASADFLVDQAPGRYLYLQLQLTGNGTTTPVVHRIRLDFPRVTSANQLPAIYLQDPAAGDFTERFLSLFDAAFEEGDRAVERYPALLDPGGVPDEVLPWLGGLLGLVFNPAWNADIRRSLIAAAPRLYQGRGTVAALSEVIKIVFGVDVAISELATDRNWAVLNPVLNQASRLGSARLFSRSRTRFRVGGSALSSAPIRSFGNPDDDPLTAQANRIQVGVPPAPGRGGPDLAALRALVASQAPAHIVRRGPAGRAWSRGRRLVHGRRRYRTRPAAGSRTRGPAGRGTAGDARPPQRGLAVGTRIVGGHPAGTWPSRRQEHGGPVREPVRGHAMTTGLSDLTDFLRLRYFHGQLLDACDFQREQAYFVEKLRLRNRCLHGYGVACGLLVSPVPSADPWHRLRPAPAAGNAASRRGCGLPRQRDRDPP